MRPAEYVAHAFYEATLRYAPDILKLPGENWNELPLDVKRRLTIVVEELLARGVIKTSLHDDHL